MHESQLFQQCAPAIGLMTFAMWGLGPLLQFIHRTILRVCLCSEILCYLYSKVFYIIAMQCYLLQKEDWSWKDSQLNHIMRMYVRPVLLVCR